MIILIFTEGTILMHSDAAGKLREDIIRQIADNSASVEDYAAYIPIGNASQKINNWVKQGAVIYYLTSRTSRKEINDIKNVLIRYDFPLNNNILFRKENESYSDVAEQLKPDVLIEDDCESIGGEAEMTITNMKPELKSKIKSVVMKEFEGIGHLPDNISNLRPL